MSVAGFPAADATSDSGPDHLPPTPKQSAQCSAARAGPAGRRLHPGRKQMEADERPEYISLDKILPDKYTALIHGMWLVKRIFFRGIISK